MSSLRDWLQANGLDQYSDKLHANGIDLDVIASLDDGDLRELGLNLGDRKRFLAAVATPNKTEIPTATSTRASPAEAERRQLTVMFCDMVGFTELASRLDPEVLQTIVRSYEDTCAAAITRYEGYVFQRLGDGIVAFFGYPLAHEGEAEGAIRAGLDIIDALSNLEVSEVGHLSVRIGIATGMVVVASVEKGAVGETMNLASRLQGVAPVNTIVVSERVQRLAGGTFEYQDLGEQTLKGISQPTHAYRVLGVSKASSRFDAAHGESLTPLVGRALELGLLMDRWALAQEGEGQVVLLSGEPGIGKSRILSALRERLEGEGTKSLRFQCSPYYVNSAFWPSITNFERALKFSRDESSESKLDKLESLIVGHYRRPLSDVRFVASILSIPCDERYGEVSITPQKFKDETLRTLVELTEAAAKKRPSVLLYEDVHWADPTSLEVLDLIIDRVKDIPLLIVLTHRPEFQNRWADHGQVSALNLSKLTRTQSRALVSGLTAGKALPDDLLEQIVARADGVPLFVEELTKSILESDELIDAGDHYEYAGSAQSVTIPATLRDSLTARLDRSAPVKEIAQIGAAIGREFSYQLIAVVAPLQRDQLDNVLVQLTDSGLAFRRGTAPQATYTFKHALVQDAAYDSLLKSKRQALHGKIAKALEERFPETRDTEPEVLAQHFAGAGMTPEAVRYWEKAGELAQKRVAYQEAVQYFDRALQLTKQYPPSTSRDYSELRLRTLLGMALVALNGYTHPQVAANLETALQLDRRLDGGEYTLQIMWGLWVYALCTGELEASLKRAQSLLTTATKRDSDDFRLAGHWAACDSHYFLGQFEDCIEHADAILELYDAERHGHMADLISHDPRTIALAYKAGAEWVLGFPDRALHTTMAAVANADQRKHAFDMCWVRVFSGHEVLNYLANVRDTKDFLEQCEKMAIDQGLMFFSSAYCPLLRALCLLHTGDATNANKQFAMAMSQWQGAGMQVATPHFKALHAECKAQCGKFEAALQLLDEALEQIEKPGCHERYALSYVLQIKAVVSQKTQRLSEAEQLLESALRVARQQKARSWELRAATSLARLWYSQGKHKEAHDLLKPVYGWFTEGFDTKDLKEAKALLNELEVTA